MRHNIIPFDTAQRRARARARSRCHAIRQFRRAFAFERIEDSVLGVATVGGLGLIVFVGTLALIGEMLR